MRLDQWLWAMRVYKTRGLAVEGIKAGRVRVNGEVAKPAHGVKVGEMISARLDQGVSAWVRTLKVLGAPPSRVGAKLVAQFAEDLTTEEEREKSRQRDLPLPGVRAPGAGRPTKRERRLLEEITDDE